MQIETENSLPSQESPRVAASDSLFVQIYFQTKWLCRAYCYFQKQTRNTARLLVIVVVRKESMKGKRSCDIYLDCLSCVIFKNRRVTAAEASPKSANARWYYI